MTRRSRSRPPRAAARALLVATAVARRGRRSCWPPAAAPAAAVARARRHRHGHGDALGLRQRPRRRLIAVGPARDDHALAVLPARREARRRRAPGAATTMPATAAARGPVRRPDRGRARPPAWQRRARRDAAARPLHRRDDGAASTSPARFAAGGGTLSMQARVAQVVYTLTQFPTVSPVDFMLDGSAARRARRRGPHPRRGASAAPTGASFEPAIFVERPGRRRRVSAARSCSQARRASSRARSRRGSSTAAAGASSDAPVQASRRRARARPLSRDDRRSAPRPQNGTLIVFEPVDGGRLAPGRGAHPRYLRPGVDGAAAPSRRAAGCGARKASSRREEEIGGECGSHTRLRGFRAHADPSDRPPAHGDCTTLAAAAPA